MEERERELSFEFEEAQQTFARELKMAEEARLTAEEDAAQARKAVEAAQHEIFQLRGK